jgi:hypothetical protein
MIGHRALILNDCPTVVRPSTRTYYVELDNLLFVSARFDVQYQGDLRLIDQ